MAVRGQVRERDLRVVSFAIGLSALGDFVALVALGLAAKNFASDGMGSGVAVSALFICLWAPLVVFAGHVGLLVDRVETRSLLIVVSLGQAAVAIALAFVDSLALLLALAAVLGTGIAVAQAAEFALVPVVAGARTLQATNSTVETARTIGFTIGPVCGSLLVAAGGTSTAMLLDGASFLVVAGAALSLEMRRRAAGQHEEEKRRARDGIGFLFGDRLVALMVVVVFVSLLFMSASIPADLVYTEDILGVENIGIGVVLSAWTLGMLVGSNVIARRVALGGLATAALAGVVVQGLGKFIAPFWLVFGFMIVAYFVGGIGHGVKNVTSRTLIHARIAPERHGRAFAAWNGVRNAAELGALAVGGVVVGSIGARMTLWLAGGLSALVGVAGLALLAAWRGRVAEKPAGVSTIGSP
jgi:MFS family permease